jgi:TPR repeat protein
MYLQGKGVKGDLEEAAKLFHQSAEAGDEKSQSQLGSLYCEGLGVVQSEENALKWWREAADRGEETVQY